MLSSKFEQYGPYTEKQSEQGERKLINRLATIKEQQKSRDEDTSDMVETINEQLIEKLSDLITREDKTGNVTEKIEMIEGAFEGDLPRLKSEYNKLKEELNSTRAQKVLQKRLANLP